FCSHFEFDIASENFGLMFPSGTDRTHVTAAVSCGVLIPTRFVWPYGGRRVYLLGSFTRWTEHLPMSLVEGCPSIFQAICSLTPGVHQVSVSLLFL
ncbi:hypothetical protein BHM03_00039321, partial [Ensete ventricosum]